LPPPDPIDSLNAIASAALQLGAEAVPAWSSAEAELAIRTTHVELPLEEIRERITAGQDPLGEAYCRIRSAENRRELGQTYTPQAIVDAMLDWAAAESKPSRVIDPGSGSGRFALHAARRFASAEIVATDVDPLATLMTRATLRIAGAADRATVLLRDFRSFEPDAIDGQTLYVGNPPYVRHHQIERAWKRWLLETATAAGHDASGLAGLHVYFFQATACRAKPGDVGVFITAAEWLDVNYGSLVRQLLLDDLGGLGIHVLDADAIPFSDAATTGVITTFQVGSKPKSIRLRRVKRVEALGRLEGGRSISRERLAEARRWSPLIRVAPKLPEGWIELGELCRVHRGQATGANGIWVARPDEVDLPASLLFRSVTRARELFAAGEELATAEHLRCVIDLPTDLDQLDSDSRRAVNRFLRKVKRKGAADGYLAQNRRAWWSVGLRNPAPILATYMARRPPAFVRNLASARHINIAHGLYPRQPFGADVLDCLAAALRESVVVGQGRTYAGGLTKFEPREMERLPVPSLELLRATA
jgi:methylase of polypeptide subunit release factors